MDEAPPHDERIARARELERGRVRAEMHVRLFASPSSHVQVGRFMLRRKLGEGATSIVYAAFDPELARDVAVKLVLVGPVGDEPMRAEARAMAQLHHPNLLTAFETGVHDGIPFIVTELVEGGSLRTFLEQAHPPEARLEMVLGIGRGVAEAHRRGFVHRDLKPENVLVGDGRPRIADFGLAQTFAPVTTSEHASGAPLPGTPAYMSPEHKSAYRADPSSDQFSFAVLAFEVCFGRHPLVAGPSHDDPAHPLAFVAPILRRGFEERPSARWPSVDALVAALEQARSHARTPARSRALLVAALASTLVVGVALAFVFRAAPAAAPSGDSAPGQTLFELVMPMMSRHDYDGCARFLEARARTEAEAVTWIACADRATDAASLDRACAAWPRFSSEGAPDECEVVRRAARRELRDGKGRACVERLLAAPPTSAGLVLISQCMGPVDDSETRRRVCMYGLAVSGDPHPERGCGALEVIGDGPGGSGL